MLWAFNVLTEAVAWIQIIAPKPSPEFRTKRGSSSGFWIAGGGLTHVIRGNRFFPMCQVSKFIV